MITCLIIKISRRISSNKRSNFSFVNISSINDEIATREIKVIRRVLRQEQTCRFEFTTFQSLSNLNLKYQVKTWYCKLDLRTNKLHYLFARSKIFLTRKSFTIFNRYYSTYLLEKMTWDIETEYELKDEFSHSLKL